jgi:N-acetylmuramoyl-L-alanine amidase/LysM repeat protein
MSKYIALDDGHGIGTAGKRTPYIAELGRSIQENEFNREVVKYLDTELKRCGFKTLLTAPTDNDDSLGTRVARANNAGVDLFMSIHFNALDGVFHGGTKDPEGFSAHVHSTQYNSAKFARIALKHLAGGTKQKNRGLVQQNLYVTRETKMPAVLFELGFMDNKREALLMLDEGFQKECAVELAKAVCEFYGVSYKAEPKPQPEPAPVAKGVTHKVVSGDTLWGLSREYNVSVDKLKSMNGLKSNTIVVGDVLVVSDAIHIVKSGDTLWGIAREHKTTVSKIKSLNGLKSDIIHTGDKLRVK